MAHPVLHCGGCGTRVCPVGRTKKKGALQSRHAFWRLQQPPLPKARAHVGKQSLAPRRSLRVRTRASLGWPLACSQRTSPRPFVLQTASRQAQSLSTREWLVLGESLDSSVLFFSVGGLLVGLMAVFMMASSVDRALDHVYTHAPACSLLHCASNSRLLSLPPRSRSPTHTPSQVQQNGRGCTIWRVQAVWLWEGPRSRGTQRVPPHQDHHNRVLIHIITGLS